MIDTDVINVTIDRSKHTVLVVDDNAATRYATSRVLRAAGFLTDEAANGTDAISKSATGVAGVVLDVHLPDIDGFEVCRRIRSSVSTEHLPIVHLSATHVGDEDRVTGLNAGADAYLVHPVEPAVVIATLQALIRARMAEERLRRSEQRFRAIYNHAQGGIALLDREGIFTDANPAMLAMLGRPEADVIGRPLTKFAPADWLGTLQSQVEALASSGRTRAWHGEFPLQAADGRVVYLEWNISAPTEDGLRIAVANDASERHELEERRRDVLAREQSARAQAERHSRTKDDFVAVLSHELRTPLNSIVGWVAIMMRRNPSPETIKGLDAIDRSVKTQARIISDILDVSRINSGKMTLVCEWVDPAEVISDALASLKSSVDAKEIVLDPDLTEAGGAAWLDPSRYQQICWNLMTNAVKFSSRGGLVRVTLKRTGDRLRLDVQDFGEGIAPEFLPHLFDRFAQSDAPGNRSHGGLGLGLSIVKNLAELHDGTVQAFSKGSGSGTLMSVDISVVQPAVQEASSVTDSDPVQRPVDADVAGNPLQGLRVLVVEDDHGAGEMLAVVLSDRGAMVEVALDFNDAIRALERAWPDVLVSDIGLPGRDGYELIQQVRMLQPASMPRLPAVALTAFAREEDKARALESGFDAHLAKPLRPHALVAAILDISRPGGTAASEVAPTM